MSLALVPQQPPVEVSLQPGEEGYCRASFTDLKGTEFRGVVQARTTEKDVTTFQVFQEHPEYEAETDEIAFEYAAPLRSTITVNGRSIGEGDIIVIDRVVHFISVEKPAPPEAVTFANDVVRCIAGTKS